MKKLFLSLLAVFFVFALNARQLTVFGSSGKLNLNNLPLKVNRFDLKKGQKLADITVLRICESIDNSKFVYFPTHPSPHVAGQLFSKTAICQSLKSLLERGGIIFFGATDWSTLASRPRVMDNFFNTLKIKLPGVKHYRNTVAKGEKSVAGTIVPEYKKSIFTTPKKVERFLAIRHTGSLKDTSFKPLIKTADNMILAAIHDNGAGKGKVIFSHIYSLRRNTESPFIENMLTAVYGPMRKLSRREKLRQQNVPQTAAVTAFDLSKPSTFELILSKRAGKPKAATKVKLSGNKDKLIAEFFCTGTSAPVAKVTKRDDNVWNDDSVEIAIATSMKRDARVFHYIVNTRNVVYDAQNGNAGWNCKNFKSTVKKNGNNFYIKMEIPIKDFKVEKVFRMNVGREEVANKELSSWTRASHGFAALNTMKVVSFTPRATYAVTAPRRSAGELKIMEVPLFTRIYPDSTPGKADKPLKNIKVVLPRNDVELRQIVFFNTSDENYLFRIEPELTSKCGDIFSFRELHNWQAPTGEVFAEIETPLNTANLIYVPGGECKVLLLACKTLRNPGVYKWSFEIVPVNVKMAKKKISVEARVLPLTMDTKKMPGGYGFGPYSFSWASVKGYRQQYWKQLQQYHINHVMANEPHRAIIPGKGSLTISDDLSLYTNDEDFLAANVKGWSYGYGVVERFKSIMKRAGVKKSFRDPEILKLFEKWVANWSKALKQKKVDFKRFTVPMQDEPRTEALPDLIAAAKILRKYGFRLNCTLATWTTLEDIRIFSPYLDMPIPWEPLVTTRSTAAEALKYFKKNSPLMMPYLCSIGGDFSPLQQYFRFRGIRTWQVGGDGIALWAVNSWRGNDYRSAENRKVNGAFLIHHGDERGFVPTFRLEAFREAIEDLYYLKQAEKSSSPAVKKLIAPAFLKNLMTQDSPAATAAWHQKLLEALAAQK